MCFLVEDFSGDAPIRSPEQQACKGDALAGRTQPSTVQQALNVTGRGSAPAWAGRGDIRVHEADNPGIGTPSVCRIRKMLSVSTNAAPSNAAMWVSRLFAN